MDERLPLRLFRVIIRLHLEIFLVFNRLMRRVEEYFVIILIVFSESVDLVVSRLVMIQIINHRFVLPWMNSVISLHLRQSPSQVLKNVIIRMDISWNDLIQTESKYVQNFKTKSYETIFQSSCTLEYRNSFDLNIRYMDICRQSCKSVARDSNRRINWWYNKYAFYFALSKL